MRPPIATRIWTYGSVPVLAVVLFVALIQVVGPFLHPDPSIPPAESLSIERIDVEERGFALKIRVDSPEPVVIAQIQVDGAFWTFSQAPPGPVRRMQTAWLQVPFPWVMGETHHLRLITRTGITFDDSVDIAVTSPTPTWGAAGGLHAARHLCRARSSGAGHAVLSALEVAPPHGARIRSCVDHWAAGVSAGRPDRQGYGIGTGSQPALPGQHVDLDPNGAHLWCTGGIGEPLEGRRQRRARSHARRFGDRAAQLWRGARNRCVAGGQSDRARRVSDHRIHAPTTSPKASAW